MAGKTHLVGAAGVGMSGLAQALLAEGWEVSGSDRYVDIGQELDIIAKLRRTGVRFVPQDGSGIGGDVDAVVVSTAIEGDNPDVTAAERHGVPVLHRADMLAQLVQGKELIAVTGTSGKTTVAGMTGYLLERLGEDPTVVNGGILANWETADRVGNVRIGGSRRWVIEADESDRSLLRFRPDWAVITNVSADHFPLAETRELFRAFAAQVEHEVIGPAAAPLSDVPTELSAHGARFALRGVDFELSLLGRHNVENAVNAALLCERLGHPLSHIAEALRGFRGIRRRLDLVGRADGVTVIDDYAHNPAKIRAAWLAVEPFYSRVIAVWRPHGFGPLRKMQADLLPLFHEMAAAGAALFLLPVYYVGGTADASVTSQTLAAELREAGTPVELTDGCDDLVERLAAECLPGDGVLVMGARDPGLPGLARRILKTIEPTSQPQ
jgi:UDP-N-acetylmuramate--alanine ligase